MSHRKPQTLLLTLDAFGTVFHPRQPVPEQYAAAAHAFSLPRSTITPDRLKAAFKSTFKKQSQTRPNYGREDVLRGRYGGPRQWWEEVIRGSFAQVLTSTSGSASTGTGKVDGAAADAVPDALVSHLLDRFAGSEGYALFDDVAPFLAVVRAVKSRRRGLGPFERVLVGVISNSDDRVPAVLKALGLTVGDVRADQGVESMRLPGFEERVAAVGSGGKGAATINDVDLVITSYEAGEEKPSRVIFDVARRQARRLLGDEGDGNDWVCVHVGDDFDKDYRAALNAGWDGYYLPRGTIAQDTRGNKTIHSLMDLIPELETYR
ncbi:hypothetical protein CDV55_104179 [Aspergillus turcosus]|nr:hypothetical protein CDV55_104179 [Aspergillus turcosus]